MTHVIQKKSLTVGHSKCNKVQYYVPEYIACMGIDKKGFA